MRLLALLMLMRCALDPECGPYYTVPAITALLAWEGLDGRLSLGALTAMALFSFGEHAALAAATLGIAQVCWLAGTVGLTAHLLRGEFRLVTAPRHGLIALVMRRTANVAPIGPTDGINSRQRRRTPDVPTVQELAELRRESRSRMTS
jgi:hypothetical protein